LAISNLDFGKFDRGISIYVLPSLGMYPLGVPKPYSLVPKNVFLADDQCQEKRKQEKQRHSVRESS